MVLSSPGRAVRFWSRHLFLLNVALFGLVWLLYGNPSLRGHGFGYWSRTNDFWLTESPARYNSDPGIENVLLPGIGAAGLALSNAVGFDARFAQAPFAIFTAVPYALFIYGISLHVSRRRQGGRMLALAATAALYATGMIPYMTSWGGYVDGLSYLLMLPVFIWPESLAVYAAAAFFQCLNHYLGAIALLLFAFVWHSLRAIERAPAGSQQAWSYWLTAFVPRAVLTALVLGAFMWFWEANYPEASRVRQTLVAEKWQNPALVLSEVLGPFPFTLLSALKLGIVPVVALAVLPQPYKGLRALAISAPFLAGAILTFVFVDVTRVMTMLVLPVFLITVHAAGRQSPLPPMCRRRLRRLVIVTAMFGLLIPNYYVNNGAILVPPSAAIHAAIAWFAR